MLCKPTTTSYYYHTVLCIIHYYCCCSFRLRQLTCCLFIIIQACFVQTKYVRIPSSFQVNMMEDRKEELVVEDFALRVLLIIIPRGIWCPQTGAIVLPVVYTYCKLRRNKKWKPRKIQDTSYTSYGVVVIIVFSCILYTTSNILYEVHTI